MIQICNTENQNARAEVARCPAERTTSSIAGGPILEERARDHGPLLERWQEEFRGRDACRARLCVERVLDAEKAQGSK